MSKKNSNDTIGNRTRDLPASHIHITKQYKTTSVKIKTNTVQDIPKWNRLCNV